MRIGLLSDTHGWIHPSIEGYFTKCDEIWHAGDIGDMKTAKTLSKLKPFRAVHGNIDGNDLRSEYPSELRFTLEGQRIWITHIGGHPGNYSPSIKERIKADSPNLFICGHSHIARVIHDKKLNMLYINPGASGYIGIHKVITIIRFEIGRNGVSNLELIELGERSKVN